MKTVDYLRSISDFVSLGPVQESDIDEAESSLSLRFSPEYREYVRECGIASADGHELTGICKSGRLNVVHVTENNRHLNVNIPKDLYVIEETNFDGGVIWQSATGEIYCSTQNSEPEKIANSIYEYLNL